MRAFTMAFCAPFSGFCWGLVESICYGAASPDPSESPKAMGVEQDRPSVTEMMLDRYRERQSAKEWQCGFSVSSALLSREMAE